MADHQIGLWGGIRTAAPLLVSVAALMLGLGLLQSLLGVRATIEGFTPALTGALMSSYYVGFLAGSIWIPRVLVDVGHIRAFAALASLASAAFLLHGVFLQPAAWAVMRLVTGVCISGLTVVVESWLNGAAGQRTRGQILSVYMVLVFGGIAGGQLLLNVEAPEEVGLFVLASVLVSVAVVPVSLARRQAPVVAEGGHVSLRELAGVAPVAAFTAVAAGMAHGALLTIGAVYATAIGLRVSQVAGFMAAAVLGGLVLQMPVGRLSDRFDRREVVALVGVLAAGAAAVTALYGSPDIPWRIGALAAALGAFTFPLYSVAVAHLNDRIQPQHIVPAGAKVVLAYGIGAVAGPVTASSLMSAYSPAAFMWFLAGIHVLVAANALYRMSRWSPLEVKGAYAPVPAGATSMVFALTPDAPEDATHPERHHRIGTRDTVIAADERGDGESVVLVHDAGSSRGIWRHTVRALSSSGFRAISYDLRGHGGSAPAPSYRLDDHVDDLDQLMRSLVAGPAHLVGLGAGATIALEYARAHPAARSLIFVSCARRIVSSVHRQRLASHTIALAERTLSQVTGRRTHARRLARTLYDPKQHPTRFELIAEDAAAAQPRAVKQTYAETVRSTTEVPVLPTLVVLGARDAATTREAIETYQRSFGLDSVRVIEGAGHFVPMDNPEGFEDALAGFLVEGILEATREPGRGV